jgi:hypothetical protein
MRIKYVKFLCDAKIAGNDASCQVIFRLLQAPYAGVELAAIEK